MLLVARFAEMTLENQQVSYLSSWWHAFLTGYVARRIPG